MEKKITLKKSGIAGLVLSLVVLAPVSLAVACGPPGMHRDGADFAAFMLERTLDRVDATEEQREEIASIVERTRSEVEAVREAGDEDPREEILAILSAPTVDAAALEALRAEHAARMDRVSQIVVASVVEASQVLTAEQRAELAEIAQERFENRRGFHGPGRHFGPRPW